MGMGGLGKTTIARAVFDDISNHFEGRSYVANVRDVSKSSGLHSLQEKILSEILMERDLKVRSVDEGIIVMKRLRRKKVLLVLDDVDQSNQLDALAGNRDWFGKGSRIIITTRDKHLLVAREVKQIYKVVLLNDDEALLLFSRYAFQSKSPPKEYVEPSRLVVRNVGGLPLALKASGSFLCGRGLDVWKSTQDILKHVPDNEIVDILKISFDGLKRIEKEMFLDIACFFIGMKKDDVSKILESSDLNPDIVISVLEQKSLITVSKGTLQMHDLIRHMGLHIVQQIDPGRRTRVWLIKDADAVFTDDKGTEAIESIKLDKSKMRFTSDHFRNMKKLRLLHVSFDSETGLQGPEYLPNELRWICWRKFPSKSLPASYQAENLVCLDMPFSNIIGLWEGKKILDKLKFIDLSKSDKLIRTPDFSGVPNLERLILCGCTSLKEVDPSLGDLKRLILLDFSTCERLTDFPSDFNMISLEILILSGCSELKMFPKIMGNMGRLRELYLDGTMIERLHPSIEKLTGLVLTNLSNCKNLRHLPSTLGSLNCMKTLDLCGCIKLKELPKNLGQMALLEELLLNGTAITRPPSSIVQLKNLKTLSFGRPTSLSNLTSCLFKWRSLKSMGLVWQCLTGSSFIKKLNLSYCDLYEIPGNLSQLYFLEELSLSGNEFTCLPDSLCQLSKLKVLELKDCTRLVALKELPTSIAMLIMDDCKSLESLGDLLTTKYKWLHEVSFSNCFKLTKNEQRGSSSRSSGFADMLLRTMLQGRSVKNHQFSILVPGSKIPDWFTHQGSKKFPDLQLLPNWHERIVGFAMCGVFRTTIPFKIGIFSGLNYKMLIFNESWCQMLSSDHLWMGYISLDFFREPFPGKYKKNKDWLGGTEESFLRIHPTSTCHRIKKCGINVVYRDDVKKLEEEEEEEEEDDDDDSSQSAGNFGFFPTKKGVGHFYFE